MDFPLSSLLTRGYPSDSEDISWQGNIFLIAGVVWNMDLFFPETVRNSYFPASPLTDSNFFKGSYIAPVFDGDVE